MKAVGTFIFSLVVLLQQNIDHVICQNCTWECNGPGLCDFENYMETNIMPLFNEMRRAIDVLSMKKPKIEIGLLPFGETYGDVLQPSADDEIFKFSVTNNSNLPLLYPTLNIDDPPSFIRILNDGIVVIDDSSYYHRFPTSNKGPSIAGYAEDFITKGINPGNVYIRQQVDGKPRQIINDDINRFLDMNGNSPSFSSKFLFLVTYNNTARYSMDHLRFTFQIAVASDGIRSFAVLIYDKLDENARYGAGYYDPRCSFLNEIIPTAESKNLVKTTNCDAKGKHVIALKRYC